MILRELSQGFDASAIGFSHLDSTSPSGLDAVAAEGTGSVHHFEACFLALEFLRIIMEILK